MIRRFWLLTITTSLACIGQAQIHLNENPTIEYTTSAVPAHKAVDEIARLAEKKLRVAEPLSHQPIILRLHNAPYKDVLKWLAATLNGAWVDKDNYKTLTRTSYVNLTLKNQADRQKARSFADYLLNRQTNGIKNVLNAESARQYILTLYGENADRQSAEFKRANLNSADTRLIDLALSGIRPLDLATVTYPDHAVFSNRPRFTQHAIRMSDSEFNKMVQEQNLWTATLKNLAAKDPNFKRLAASRLPIEKGSRVMIVFSNPVDGVPTHLVASVLAANGNPRVRAERNIHIPQARNPGIDWATHGIGAVPLSAVSNDFVAAVSGGAVTPALKDILLGPGRFDPLQLVVADGLLNIGKAKNWNVVATVPDALLLDNDVLSSASNGSLDGQAFMRACEKRCRVTFNGGVLTLTPLDPVVAEGKRTSRVAMESYIASLDRAGYSTTMAESALADKNSWRMDTSLVKLYARLLQPSATPFLDTPVEALALYGSFTPQNRKWLNDGMSIPLADFNEAQKPLLGAMLLNGPRRILIDKQVERIFTNRQDPEITNLVDGPITPSEEVTLARREETVLRVKGVDVYGREWDQVLTTTEAPSVVRRQGPWQSIQYASAKANVIKLTLRASSVADVVYFLREYPEGFSPFGDMASLPLEVKKALANWTGATLVK